MKSLTGEKIKKIMIRSTNWIGDAVTAEKVFQAVAELLDIHQ